MSLIPTRVVDKNGRATTVHKRSGSSAVRSKTFAASKPVTVRPQKKKIDETFEFPVDNGYSTSRFGIVLNQMRPDLALNQDSVINVSSRDVYSLARHGFAPRNCIYFAHFKMDRDDVVGFMAHLARMGYEPKGKLRERRWMDVMLEEDIDHSSLLDALNNGLMMDDLDEMHPSNAPGTIKAYGYKGFSKTELAKRVRDGKIAWDDIKSIGVSRAAKYDGTIIRSMYPPKNAKHVHPLDFPTMGEIIRDAESRPRTSMEDGVLQRADYLISLHSEYYRMVGEKFWDLRTPDVIMSLSRMTGIQDDFIGYTAYCDEVIHAVRSDAGTSETIISANGGKSRKKIYGTYEGQYGEQADPYWNMPSLISYRKAGLSVEEAVYALTKGLDAERARGVLRSGVPLAVNDGWL